MTDRRRSVTLMLHRDGDLSSRSVRLPEWAFRALTITGVVLGVLIVIAAILYAPIVRTAARVPGLNREVSRLRQENSRVRELAATLGQMEERYDQLRTMLGGDAVAPRTPIITGSPVAAAVLARVPGERERYESGPSVPGHWPLEERGIVTRGTVGAEGDTEEHTGLDIAVPVGTPIRASGGGAVSQAGQDAEYGFFVLLSHPEGYESMYGHASRLLVSVGDTVTAGQVIALSGSTGRSTAPHLHFEIRRDGRSIDPRTLVQEGI